MKRVRYLIISRDGLFNVNIYLILTAAALTTLSEVNATYVVRLSRVLSVILGVKSLHFNSLYIRSNKEAESKERFRPKPILLAQQTNVVEFPRFGHIILLISSKLSNFLAHLSVSLAVYYTLKKSKYEYNE